MTKTERKEKRKALRPWKGLTIWCIIFALTFSIFTPMFHILDNDFMYALVNSAAMNGVGPNTEISKVVFWPATLSFVLAIVFWGLTAFCAVRWHRRRKEWFTKKQSDTKNN